MRGSWICISQTEFASRWPQSVLKRCLIDWIARDCEVVWRASLVTSPFSLRISCKKRLLWALILTTFERLFLGVSATEFCCSTFLPSVSLKTRWASCARCLLCQLPYYAWQLNLHQSNRFCFAMGAIRVQTLSKSLNCAWLSSRFMCKSSYKPIFIAS